jgi:hypothetical protein
VATESQRIEREILHTRERLGDDVDALVEKVDPRRVAAREATRAASSVRAHPRTAAAVAIGAGALLVAWMVWRRRVNS